MKDDDLAIGKNSNSLSPFNWKNFKKVKKDYNLYREYLGSKIVILNNTNTALYATFAYQHTSILAYNTQHIPAVW